jgi:uncharacterized protein (UPF0332 family)
MGFDWSYYLEVAQELTDQAKEAPPELQEAKYRAAISRAYYAAFGSARDHLRYTERKKEPAYTPNIHEYVIQTFLNHLDSDGQHPDPDGESIGDHLMTMRKERNAVDYDLDCDFVDMAYHAKLALRGAKRVFELLDILKKRVLPN